MSYTSDIERFNRRQNRAYKTKAPAILGLLALPLLLFLPSKKSLQQKRISQIYDKSNDSKPSISFEERMKQASERLKQRDIELVKVYGSLEKGRMAESISAYKNYINAYKKNHEEKINTFQLTLAFAFTVIIFIVHHVSPIISYFAFIYYAVFSIAFLMNDYSFIKKYGILYIILSLVVSYFLYDGFTLLSIFLVITSISVFIYYINIRKDLKKIKDMEKEIQELTIKFENFKS